MRVKAVIAYDGTDFEGFQRQKRTKNTITTAIETALQTLNIHIPIIGSGRTDAGVHATGQVIHFDLPPFWSDVTKLRDHLNARLDAIRFKHITPVSDDFHARYDAKRRLYRYCFSSTPPDLFQSRYVAHVPVKDWELLEAALKILEGTHDFGAFKKTGSPTQNDIRILYKAQHFKRDKYHTIYFEADGFLRAQVRMMLGATFAVANHHLTLDQLREQLHHHTRHTHDLAPAEGLYLARVMY